MGTVFLPQNSTTQRWGAAWTNAKDHCSGGGTYAYDSYFLEKYGCFLKWSLNTPKWSFVVGKPMVVGYHHFRKPPYGAENLLMFVRNPIYFSDIRRFAPCFFSWIKDDFCSQVEQQELSSNPLQTPAIEVLHLRVVWKSRRLQDLFLGNFGAYLQPKPLIEVINSKRQLKNSKDFLGTRIIKKTERQKQRHLKCLQIIILQQFCQQKFFNWSFSEAHHEIQKIWIDWF